MATIWGNIRRTIGHASLVDFMNANPPAVSLDFGQVVRAATGTTSYAAALSAADTAALTSGLAVVLAPGTYAVASSLSIVSPLDVRPGAVLRPAAGVTVTVYGVASAPTGQWIDTSLGGTVAFVRGAFRETYPEWWGAVGDNTTDDASALNHWLAALKGTYGTGRLAGKRYRFRTALDATDSMTGGFSIVGAGTSSQSGAGSVLVADTAGVGLDMSGSQSITLAHFDMVSGSATPSTVGILQARTTTGQYAQKCVLRDIHVALASAPSANGGYGSVAYCNIAAEITTHEACWYEGDKATFVGQTNVPGVASPYRTLDTSITSCSNVTFDKNCILTAVVGGSGPSLDLSNPQNFSFDGYLNGQGATGNYGVRIAGGERITIRGHCEGWKRVLTLAGGVQEMDVDMLSIVPTGAGHSVFMATNTQLVDSRIRIKPTLGSAIVPLVSVQDTSTTWTQSDAVLFGGQAWGWGGFVAPSGRLIDINAGTITNLGKTSIGQGVGITKVLKGTKTWDPPSVATGAVTTTTLTFTGETVVVGDLVIVSFSNAVPAGLLLTGQITSANTATVTLANFSGGAVDLASGTLTVVVIQAA